jgi:hypothetical protein
LRLRPVGHICRRVSQSYGVVIHGIGISLAQDFYVIHANKRNSDTTLTCDKEARVNYPWAAAPISAPTQCFDYLIASKHKPTLSKPGDHRNGFHVPRKMLGEKIMALLVRLHHFREVPSLTLHLPCDSSPDSRQCGSRLAP